MLTEFEINILERDRKLIECSDYNQIVFNLACKSGSLEYIAKFIDFPKIGIYDNKTFFQEAINNEKIFQFLVRIKFIDRYVIMKLIENRSFDMDFIESIFKYCYRVKMSMGKRKIKKIYLKIYDYDFIFEINKESSDNIVEFGNMAIMNKFDSVRDFSHEFILSKTKDKEVFAYFYQKLGKFQKEFLLGKLIHNKSTDNVDKFLSDNIWFHDAFIGSIRTGNFYLVKKLIILVNWNLGYYISPLELAIKENFFEIFEFLVEFFNINDDGILIEALRNEDRRYFRILITNPRLDTNSEVFMKAFIFSLRENRFYEDFLDFDNFDINLFNDFKLLQNKTQKFYIKFLSKYKDINILNKAYETILIASIKYDIKILFDLILLREDLDINFGAAINEAIKNDIYYYESLKNFRGIDLNSNNLLIKSARLGNSYICEDLLSRGINPNTINIFGDTALVVGIKNKFFNHELLMKTDFIENNFMESVKNYIGINIPNNIVDEIFLSLDKKFSTMKLEDVKTFLDYIDINSFLDRGKYNDKIKPLLKKYYWSFWESLYN